MKTFKIILLTLLIGLTGGAVLFYEFGPEKKVVETVERYTSSVPGDIKEIIEQHPDLAEAVRIEAQIRSVREKITSHEESIDSLTQQLLELENEALSVGFTNGTTPETN